MRLVISSNRVKSTHLTTELLFCLFLGYVAFLVWEDYSHAGEYVDICLGMSFIFSTVVAANKYYYACINSSSSFVLLPMLLLIAQDELLQNNNDDG